MGHWYAIHTKPRQEELARQHLMNQGISVYLPQMRCRVRHARQTKEVQRPLFPGYLFIWLEDTHCPWTAIRSTVGVLAPVRFGDVSPTVPADVIASLHELEGEDRLIDPARLEVDELRPGTEVKVDFEGLEGLRAVIHKVDGEGNVRLLLDILGRQVVTKVKADQFLKA